MEKISRKIKMALVTISMMITLAITVSADKVGDGYQAWGIQIGWFFLIPAVIVGFLMAFKYIKLPKGNVALGIVVFACFVIGAFCLAVDAPTADITDEDDMGDLTFDITASALTTDGTYYPDTRFDDASNVFIVPFQCNTTSDTLYEQGDNSSYSDDPVLQFVCDPDYPADATGDNLGKIYFTITNPDLYVGSNSDNRVLTETNDVVQATWTDQDGNTDMVDGWASRTLPNAITLNLTLNLYEAGISQVDDFDPDILYIKFYNGDNTWSESYTVQFESTGHYPLD